MIAIIASSVYMFGQNTEPYLIVNTSGAVIDFVIDNDTIYAATDAGVIDIINLNTGKKIDKIVVPDAQDFMGDIIPSKIFSVDKISDKIIFVWQGNRGFRNVSMKQNHEITNIIDADINKLMIKKVRFVDEDRILLGLLSNELLLYNMKSKIIEYKKQISAYSFSDFCLNSSKDKVATSDESGIIHIINTNVGNILLSLQDNNVDNIYQIDYKNGVVITAGQDRRVGIYNTLLNEAYYRQEDFLVYSVALSNTAEVGAYSASEDNKISVFNIISNTVTNILVGHSSTINKILFVDNNTIITAAEESVLIIWKIR